MKFMLKDRIQEAPDVYSFLFEPEEEVAWKAGQFLRYTLEHGHSDDRGARRFFTIASAPHEGHIRVTTRVDVQGGSSFKRALLALAPQDAVEASRPMGTFVAEDPEQEYVFIAGGIGITPFRAILQDWRRKEVSPKAQLLYANRDEHVCFQKELEEIAQVRYVLGGERITEGLVSELVPDLQAPKFYVSGPEAMVMATESMLYGMGVRKDRVERDYFSGY